eukprot:TRINITY_DN32611_c0_g1_i1.p1 TRINITY_DN32611_c0_g1~~TRINITY_DN32611_c0_g1_i1.p1  ORF type:complete len:395 (-),score=59.49 TRINITY_DN32611_c0_g1_i1:540-1724(-)
MSLYSQITSNGVLLLDGEVGGALRKMANEENSTTLLPASVILDAPELLYDLHTAYIEAGAQIITTNTYATVRQRVEALLGMGDRWEEMVTNACKLAVKAREDSGKNVLIAGSLPPLAGSYRPDKVGEAEEIRLIYKEHVALMKEHVDFFLCETMSTALEGWAAASAAAESGKPVWIAWNCLDDGTVRLRSGESLMEAWAAVAHINPDAVLVNCVMPETVIASLSFLSDMGPKIFGGYGNGFTCIPEGWTIQNGGLKALGKRRDLTPELYTKMAQQWIDGGARVVGGCCEVGPEYIRCMSDNLNFNPQGKARSDSESSETSQTTWYDFNKSSVSSQSSLSSWHIQINADSKSSVSTSHGEYPIDPFSHSRSCKCKSGPTALSAISFTEEESKQIS